MRGLLLVAHGSRREASNDEVRKIADLLRQRAGDRYGAVEAGFLELADPLIPDGIECLIRQGASEVVVLPYFLSAGRHVAQDIPAEVAPKQAQYPQIPIHIAPYLGSAEGIVELLVGLSE
ncbi:MAG: sirohydrochlorin chelatase [Thiohalomonadaceae bacterium]